MTWRLLLSRLRHRVNWTFVRLCLFLGYLVFCLVFVINFLQVKEVADENRLSQQPQKLKSDKVYQDVLDFEAKFVPGLGEYGKGVPIEDKRE